jgi:rRNA maturation endonuclease Nob1
MIVHGVISKELVRSSMDVQHQMLLERYDPRDCAVSIIFSNDESQRSALIYFEYILSIYPHESADERLMRKRLHSFEPSDIFRKAVLRDSSNLFRKGNFGEYSEITKKAFNFFTKNPSGICLYIAPSTILDYKGGFEFFDTFSYQYVEKDFQSAIRVKVDGIEITITKDNFYYVSNDKAATTENKFGFIPKFCYAEITEGQKDFYPYALAVDSSIEFIITYSNVMFEKSRLNTVKEEVQTQCDICFGSGKDLEGDTCNSCGGEGHKHGYSQMRFISIASGFEKDGEKPAPAGVNFKSPDSSFYGAKTTDLDTARLNMKRNFHLNDDNKAGAETAESKKLDRDKYVDFINSIGNRLLDYARFVAGVNNAKFVNSRGKTEYALGDTEGVTYTPYEQVSNSELIELISSARSAGVSQSIIQEIENRIIVSDFEKKKSELRKLTTFADSDIKTLVTLVSTGLMTNWQSTATLYNDYLVNNLISEIGIDKFIAESIMALQKRVFDAAKNLSE